MSVNLFLLMHLQQTRHLPQVPRLDLSVLKELIEAGTCVRFG